MNYEWSLREEIIKTTHNWPMIVFFGVVGILLGYIASFIWPYKYQATRELYVGLNVYQVEGDLGVSGIANPQFRFADDYKNWQLANLESLVWNEKILDETLSRLQSQESYWQQVDQQELAKMLNVLWRNAGTWQLVAEHNELNHASQAVTTWGNVILQTVDSATSAAHFLLQLDLQIRIILENQAEATSQAAVYRQHLGEMINWKEHLSGLPQDQPLELNIRDELWEFSNLSNEETSSALSLNKFPSQEKPPEAYISWLERGILALNLKLQGVYADIETAENSSETLTTEYAAASEEAMGFSPNLIVEDIDQNSPTLTVIRPTGLFIFIGGMLGLIVWAIIWAARITLQYNDYKNKAGI